MLLFIIFIFICAVSFYIAIFDDSCEVEWLKVILLITGTITSIIVLLLGVLLIGHNIDFNAEAERTRLEQQYQTITTLLQNNDANVILLSEEISEYNSEVLNGRRKMNDFWLCDYGFKFYDDLPLIELEKEGEE